MTNKRFIKLLGDKVYYLVDLEKASKTLEDFKKEITADYLNDGYSQEIIEEVALEEYNEYLYENCMTATENVDLLNQLYERGDLFQQIVHNTIEEHIIAYTELLEKQDGIIRGDAVKERINALHGLRNAIEYKYQEEILQELPETPIYNCRCVIEPIEKDEMKRYRYDTGNIIDNEKGEILSELKVRNRLNQYHEEIQHIKQVIRSSYENERTELGKNVLKQLAEQVGVDLNDLDS